MGYLFDFVLYALGFLLSWRAWLCLILGLVLGAAFLKYGVEFVWRGDIMLVTGAVGLALGLIWAARVHE
jgi:hypothetical protein